jgi:hypothetical protein
VVWAARSETFAPFIERGRRLDRASVAVDWFDRKPMYEACQPVPASAWFDCSAAADVDIWEDSLSIPGVEGVISLLWIPEGVAAPFDRC